MSLTISSDGHAHRHFDQPAPAHLAGQRKGLGPLALLGAVGGEGLGAIPKDPRHGSKRLHVVDAGGLAPESRLRGIGRAETRHAAAPFDCRHQGRFLAADERPGALDDLQLELETGAHEVVAKQAALLAYLDRVAYALGRQGIFRPDIEKTLMRPDGVHADHHALQHPVREGLEDHPVHERARIAFVAVADDVLDVPGGRAGQFPFDAGGETRAAAAAQAAGLHLRNHLLGLALLQGQLHRLETVMLKVVVDAPRVERAGMLGDEANLGAHVSLLDAMAHILRVARGRHP